MIELRVRIYRDSTPKSAEDRDVASQIAEQSLVNRERRIYQDLWQFVRNQVSMLFDRLDLDHIVQC